MTKPSPRALDLFEHASHRATVESIEDLLTHPRHHVTPKDRRWLKGQLRAELEQPGSTHE
jgi:hypothetical protein